MACPDDSFGPWAGSACRGGFDFTILFEESILAIPLDVVFLLGAAPITWKRVRKDVKTQQSTKNRVRRIYKLGTASCLVILRLALLVLWARSGSEASATRTQATVPAAAISFVAAIAYLLMSWQEHDKSVRPSFEIEMYLFFSTLLNLARARTLWMLSGLGSLAGVFTASMAVQALGIIFESWEKQYVLREPFSTWAGETLAGTFNRSVFFWLNPLLLLGSRQILTLANLPPLDVKLEAERLETEFSEAWDKIANKTKSGALLHMWLSVHSKMVLAGVIPKLFQIGLLFTQPLLVERAIRFASTPDQTVFNNVGYGLIGAYALVYGGIAISTGQLQWRMARATAYMRAAIVPCVTRKTLRIDLAQASAASALTLITTDIETIDGGIAQIHELWGPFIEIGLGAYLLWRQIGSAVGIPLGVVFFVMFVAMFMAVPVGMRLAEWIKASEVRVAATSRTLGNVKSYRMSGLNSIAFAAIEKLRAQELQVSRKFRLWFGAATILPLCLPALNPVLSFAGFVGLQSSSSLSISQALTSLSILALLNRPLTNLSVALPAIAGAVASFDRIQDYLNVPEKEDKRIPPTPSSLSSSARKEAITQTSTDAGKDAEETGEKVYSDTSFSEKPNLPEGTMVTVNVKLSWPATEKPVLDIHELHIPSAAVTVLLGPTGCGKTTMLNTVLGELTSYEGSICIASLEISYCAQKPWLPNGTIHEAIVGKLDYDEDWYRRTVHACALEQDFTALAAGDQSLLGNKGTLLSGGQKQRIAIARAVYARRQLCIFDDAFKGLDNTTSETVINNLLGPHGLLRSSGFTSIISSSDNRCVRHADYIVKMDEDGKVAYQGSPGGSGLLKDVEGHETREIEEISSSSKQERSDMYQETTGERQNPGQLEGDQSLALELDGTRQTGDVSVHKFYARSAGLKSGLVFLASLLVGAFVEAFSQIWLLWWTQAIARNPDTSTGKWLGLYAALSVIGIISNLIAAWEIFIVVITNTGLLFHSLLIETTSQATMSFFNTVDQGVTVNRFSQDLQLIDMELPGSALGAAVAFANVIGQCVLIGVTGRYIAITFPFIMLIFYLIQKFYLRTSRQMRFLDIEHKAPLYSQTIETLDGLASIRAFGFEDRIMASMYKTMDDSQRPVYLLACLQQWLLFVCDMTVGVMAVILIAITSTLRDEVGVGFMGLALSNVVSFSSTVQMLLVTWVQLEISIGAVARVKKFALSVERQKYNNPAGLPPPGEDWPSKGSVSFRNVSASYPGTGRVLRNVNVEIQAGSKVGVCGRTGSGKSSLALTLFRLLEPEEGSIIIDNVDIATVPHDILQDAVVGVPQDILTLDGTLRMNVDPKGVKSDAEIKDILEKVHLWSVAEPRGGLDLIVSEDTLSLGELQVLGFARAMARKSRVLVLDEVSSSMDDTNSALVDELIRTWFKEWTIIIVAHKLESIRSFDKILVLDAGRVVEHDSPDILLENPESLFKRLYESSSTQ